MIKINVTGNAGAGKSTFARRLGNELNLPVHGLDQFFWQPGWVRTPQPQYEERITQITNQPAWIIEGVSQKVRHAADVVIFLDVNCLHSVYRCLRRNWPYLFKSRPGLPPNCPEVLVINTLVHMIFSFPKKVRPKILEDSARKQFFHLASKDDHQRFWKVLDSCGISPCGQFATDMFAKGSN